LGDMVRIASGEYAYVQGDRRMMGDRFEYVRGQRTGVLADLRGDLALRLTAVYEVRPARDVDDGLCQGFVERHQRVTVAMDAGFVAERLSERVADADRDVFDRMVRVDMQIPARLDRQIDQRMPRQRGQHMVVEADSGRDLGRSAAVQIE